MAFKFGELLDATVPLQSLSEGSYGGSVDRHVQCAQSPVHVVESAAPSGSSQLNSSANFGNRK